MGEYYTHLVQIAQLSPRHGLENKRMASKPTPVLQSTIMTRIAIATVGAPSAIGPYSQAVRVGSLIFTAGQIALDPSTQQIVPGGITEQTIRVLENLKAILEEADSSLDRAVKATVYLKDMNDFAAMNAVYKKYLGSGRVPPARSTVEVSRLPKDVLIEIDVIAES